MKEDFGREKICIFNKINLISFILIMMAGWVDIFGFLYLVGERSSFMTGRASAIGQALYNKDMTRFNLALIAVLSFIMGAYLGCKIVKAKGLGKGLMTSSLFLFFTAFFIFMDDGNFIFIKYGEVALMTMLLPLSLGCMNASTSLTPINRSTHLSGAATDIGISLAERDWNKAIFWAIKWLGFILGTYLALNFMKFCENNSFPFFIILLIPATIIFLMAFIVSRWALYLND